MKPHSPMPLVAALLLSAVFAVTAVAQAPQPPAPGAMPPMPPMPAPKNLQVLPKDLTIEQVHGIMEHWADALGTNCSHCHAEDPNQLGRNGRPRLNFADDSKPEKRTARLMFTMVKDINANYISKVPNSGMPVTCGTCHRGQANPPTFVPPPHPEHHGPPPPGAMPPMPK